MELQILTRRAASDIRAKNNIQYDGTYIWEKVENLEVLKLNFKGGET